MKGDYALGYASTQFLDFFWLSWTFGSKKVVLQINTIDPSSKSGFDLKQHKDLYWDKTIKFGILIQLNLCKILVRLQKYRKIQKI